MAEDIEAFKKVYLEEKLHQIGEKLNDSYGQPLLEELINRMERTVSHFNEEVDQILIDIKSRTSNQGHTLADLRGEEFENNEDQSVKIENQVVGSVKIETKEQKLNDEKPKKKFGFFKRKKK